ncbi:MAG: hypothetical protein LBM97_01960 [Candidatus Nomurabacteria bacterium]|jgi:hypothetical protein|nr:hypothetical protein [Candidatus Nomurabacteria bacterium]
MDDQQFNPAPISEAPVAAEPVAPIEVAPVVEAPVVAPSPVLESEQILAEPAPVVEPTSVVAPTFEQAPAFAPVQMDEPMIAAPAAEPILEAPANPLLGDMPPLNNGEQQVEAAGDAPMNATIFGSSSVTSAPQTAQVQDGAAQTVSPDALLPKKTGFFAKIKEFLTAKH